MRRGPIRCSKSAAPKLEHTKRKSEIQSRERNCDRIFGMTIVRTNRRVRESAIGLGGTEAAVKWRFLDEDKSGFDLSMFPRILFNVMQSSARRGLAEDGTRFQIPFQADKSNVLGQHTLQSSRLAGFAGKGALYFEDNFFVAGHMAGSSWFTSAR